MKINLTDWLYRNEYGYIYDEWLVSTEHIRNNTDTYSWLKVNYPAIFLEFQKTNN